MNEANEQLQRRGGKNREAMPNVDHYLLAKDADLLLDIPQDGSDTLVVPPPIEGGSREVLNTGGPNGPSLLMFLQGASAAVRTQLIYKDEFGNEAVIRDDTWGPGGGGDFINYWGPIGNFHIFPEDKGLFVRVIDPPTSGGTLAALPTWRDVRNVYRQDTVLTTSYQQIHPDIPLGSAISGTIAGDGGSMSRIFNYAAASAFTSLRWTFPGGRMIEQLPPRESFSLSNVFNFFNEVQVVPAGAKVEAKLTAPVAAPGDQVMRLVYGFTNRGPIRQDRGGVAF